ncbi:DUF397 domain-containing protein [Streptomyces sp. NBC_00076]|uniref:DUF397 domain-containing protein n=1 Tax=Streptomyces sp. NBC_00076 TaxID=2975642 RepID=UPI00324DC99A
MGSPRGARCPARRRRREAGGYAGLVPVRDSKTPAAPPLVFAAVSWSAFVARIKGE